MLTVHSSRCLHSETLGTQAYPENDTACILHASRDPVPQALRPQGPYHVLIGASVVGLASAFLRPVHRTLAFIAVGAVLFVYYYWIVNLNIVAQVVLQVLGGFFFVR